MPDEPNSTAVSQRTRFVLAASVAPWSIVPVLAVWIFIGGFDAVLSVLKGDAYFFESFFQYLTYLAQWSVIGIGVAYAATFLYGIPIYLALRKFEVTSLLAYLLAGVFGGVLLAMLFRVSLGFAVILVSCGAVVAGTFRLVDKK